jgi:hypothetical protein
MPSRDSWSVPVRTLLSRTLLNPPEPEASAPQNETFGASPRSLVETMAERCGLSSRHSRVSDVRTTVPCSKSGEAVTQDIRGAIQYLKSRTSRVGCMGFCMGGALTILSAAHNPDIDAAVTFYGLPPLHSIDVSSVGMPLQGHWATRTSTHGS